MQAGQVYVVGGKYGNILLKNEYGSKVAVRGESPSSCLCSCCFLQGVDDFTFPPPTPSAIDTVHGASEPYRVLSGQGHQCQMRLPPDMKNYVLYVWVLP